MKRWKETEAFPASSIRTVIERSGSDCRNMKRVFKMSWSQRGHDIYIIFTRNSNSNLDFSLFDVALTDRSCTIIAPDMEKHGWNFFLEVNAKDAQRIQNTDRLIIVVPKKDPTIFWRDIKKPTDSIEISDVITPMTNDEPPPEKIRHQSRDLVGEVIKTSLPSSMVEEIADEGESCEVVGNADDPVEAAAINEPNHDTLYHHLTTVKHKWHELSSEVVVLTVFVPHLDPWGTNISYAEDRIQISFKTADDAFHKGYGTSREVVFMWNVKLHKKIIPSKCSRKVTLMLMEIRLYKKEPEKWDRLLSEESVDEAKESDESSNEGRLSSGDNLSLADDNVSTSSLRPPNKTSSNSSMDSSKSAWGKPSTSKAVKYSSSKAGFTGLDNVGNSCFMNSVLQALANTRELRDFFLDKQYEQDINTNNPLGMNGAMAEVIADVMRKLWCETPRSFAPAKFRRLVGEREHRFVDYMQHDAQEFMAFLLDKLHEDLNRIKEKPCYEMPEVGDRDDHVVAEESWKLHTSRNDSYIVDLFHGMFKSKLYCPECKNNSVKFDPFLFLSVPLPKATRVFRVFFFSKDFSKPPVKVSVNVSKNCGQAVEVFNQISTLFHCSSESLRMYEVYKNRIHRFFVPGSSLDKVLSNDIIFVHETLSSEEADESVYEIAVLQQRTFPEMPPMCNYCKTTASDVKIKRCTKCLRIGYCNQECQRSDWPQHRKVCERTPDMVGYPFIVSIPQSKATFSYVKSLLWQQATKWTNVHCYNAEEESRTNIDPLFQIVAVNWNVSIKYDLPNLQDFGDELLDLSNYKLLCILWETDTRLSCFVKATTKALDCAVTNHASTDSFDLYNCVRLFTAPEVLAPQEAWYCPTCKEHREATKEMSLWQLPDILIVQLKRFSFKNYLWRDKLDLFVDFPVVGLDLAPYCINQAEGGPLVYDLFAVVNHYGGIYGGHYTTCVRLPSLEDTTKSTVGWRLCDDSHVMKISSESVVTKDAYVMFYRKRTVTKTPIKTGISRNLSIISEEQGPKDDSLSSFSDPSLPSGGRNSSLPELPRNSQEGGETDSVRQSVIHSYDQDCEGLEEKMALKVRLNQSDCSLPDTSRSRDDRVSVSSPELDKPLSPFTHRVAVFDDGRNSQDISVGCIIEEPLLKYDEVFPTDESVIDHDVIDDDRPGPSCLITLANQPSASGGFGFPEDQSYTDMDAVD